MFKWILGAIIALTLCLASPAEATHHTVGSGKDFTTVRAAVLSGSVPSNDSLLIYPGTYALDHFTATKPLHFVGVTNSGGLPLLGGTFGAHQIIVDGQFDQTNGIDGGKGIWTFDTGAGTTTVDNIEFKNAANPGANGSGIRLNPYAGTFTVQNCYFHDCQMEFLGNASTIVIQYCELYHSTHTEVGCQAAPTCYEHCIYINSGNTTSFTLQFSYVHQADTGNEVKSRGTNNWILYNRICDETANPGLTIDIPEGGFLYVIGNVLEQGPNSPNFKVVSYADENSNAGIQTVYYINNTFINDNSNGTFIGQGTFGAGEVAIIKNNIFYGAGNITTVTNNTQSNNYREINHTNLAGFVNDSFDFHLTLNSPSSIVNAGVDPGLAISGYNLKPVSEYVYDSQGTTRSDLGALDIGAFGLRNPTTVAPDSTLSYFVPQAGPIGTGAYEGQAALVWFVMCPNNDTQSFNARLKVTLINSSGQPIVGVAATDIYALLNGGPASQGFSGIGDDTTMASSIWQPLAGCPDTRKITACGPTDPTGSTYIVWRGCDPNVNGQVLRDPDRKWGVFAGDIPVYALGVHLQGKFTSTSGLGTYTAHIKNFDLFDNITPNSGEIVNLIDLNIINADINSHNYVYNEDFNEDGVLDTLDVNLLKQHINHKCNYPAGN